MDARAERIDSDAPSSGAREPMSDETVWHLSWAIGMAAGVAILLLAVGGVSAQALQALGFMASPGIIGAFWRPKTEERFALLTLWALGASLAVCAAGGLAGPLAVLCVTPVFACLVLGGSWRAGTGLSIAVVAFCALVGVSHLAAKPPGEPIRTWLTLIALVAAAAGAGGALLVARRRAELDREAMEDELASFQTLMGDLPDLALAMDHDGRTEAVFGQPLDGVDMRTLHAGLLNAAAASDQPKLKTAMREALANGAANAVFTPAESPDQRITVALQRTSFGGLVAILRKAPPPVRHHVVTEASLAAPPQDLTDRLTAAEAGRREAEIGRDKAEANAAGRARFLANMSHELRTPLNAIMGFSDMMRAKMFGELPPKYAEYAELIHESGGHLLDLINDVLDMSKIEAQRYTLSREMFDVRDALNAALRLMRLQADDAGVKLRAVLPDAPLMIDADKRAIKQIALNLLSNALKFTPKDGVVILTTKAVGGALEMVVADTGMGIAADDLKRLGQPFEQAGGADDRARGTGLGLSLVEAFAKLHGGALTLESRLGEGTAATVRMPVLAGAPSAEVAEPMPAVQTSVEDAVEQPVEPMPPAVEPDALLSADPQNEVEDPVADIAPPAPSAPAATIQNPSNDDRAKPGINPVPRSLGPLDNRAAEHHGLRRTVIDLFTHRPSTGGSDKPSDDHPPGGPRPNNGGVRILS